MRGSQEPLINILGELAAIGRRLVENSDSALALLEQSEAECGPSTPEPASRVDPQMSTTNPSALLTQTHLCELLQVGVRTLRRLRSDPKSKFPAPLKRARVLRWRKDDVDSWIAGRRS